MQDIDLHKGVILWAIIIKLEKSVKPRLTAGAAGRTFYAKAVRPENDN